MGKKSLNASVDGLILAGGQSRRMGRDKAMLPVAGESLLTRQVQVMMPEVAHLMVAANHLTPTLRDQLHQYGDIHWVDDYLDGAEGPLSGLMAGLTHCRSDYLWVTSCDSYGIQPQVLELLYQALIENGAEIACLRVDGREQPLQALLSRQLQPRLAQWLADGERAVYRWYRQCKLTRVDVCARKDLWYNINTPEDYQALLASL